MMPVEDANAVLVVTLPLAAPPAERVRLEGLLATDELTRANRAIPAVRDRFVVGRGRLRSVLGRVASVAAGDLEFTYGRWGKPHLAGAAAGELHFNLSHSGDQGLVAVSRGMPVGVDLEIHTEAHTTDWSARLAPTILANEELEAWRGLPVASRPRALLEAWVLKEAVMKAVGCGLAGGVRTFALPRSAIGTAAPGQPLQVVGPAAPNVASGHLTVRLLDVGEDACGALATEGTPSRVTITSFDAFERTAASRPPSR